MSEHYLDQIEREHEAACKAETERLYGEWEDEEEEDEYDGKLWYDQAVKERLRRVAAEKEVAQLRHRVARLEDAAYGQMSAQDEADADRVAAIMREHYFCAYSARDEGGEWCVLYTGRREAP